jgi:hypothetical protein
MVREGGRMRLGPQATTQQGVKYHKVERVG